MITLHSLGDDLFSIEDLSLFKRLSPGWFPIMINGDWALPFGGDEPKVREGTANAKKIGRKAARKQEILMTALKGKAE
ncbi:hypothetical protein ACFJIX_16680 [Roseateles sp. UC29_93]|uniref:hypothetical protein n=1 Tax=Roseateles sp. UC29_93 TaxID=3350177 RepID=UPI00367284E5